MTEISTLYTHLNTLTKQWFYDKGEIDTELSDVVRTSSTAGLIKNDGTIDTTSYQEAGDYIETSGTAGLVKNDGTIDTTAYADSASLAAVATSGSAADISDASAYANLGTAADASQHAINTAIDTKIGSLLAVELIEVTTNKGTASESTMNKLYLVAESTSAANDNYEIFVTVKTENPDYDSTAAEPEPEFLYAWEKVDTARIDLSGYAAIDHTHGNLSNDGKIGTNADYFVTTTTGGAVTSQEKIGNITTSGAIGSASGKIAVTTTDGVLTTSDMVSEMDDTIQALITYGNSLSS